MGTLIVIEGLDGSGKETQSNLLYEKLLGQSYPVMKISYPRYNHDSSALVKMYLRGDFGEEPHHISPYVSSTFYAADRYASYKTEYENFYKKGGIVIADRYTTSNMVHQGGKIQQEKELAAYLDWLYRLEFEIYQIPVPDKVFYLDVPLDYIIYRINNRNNKITNQEKKDIHENDLNHLQKSYYNAVKLVDKYHWDKISCMEQNRMRSIEEINQEIFYKIISMIKGD
ncbi:MAG: dTMP kinase [Eubacteriales bacterium]